MKHTDTNTPFSEQFDNLKKILDSLAYEIVQNAEDADFYDTINLRKLFIKAEVNYNTFTVHSGYERLEMYNGVKNIPNKKKIEFNPYRWLRARRLSENNKYHIPEVYE